MRLACAAGRNRPVEVKFKALDAQLTANQEAIAQADDVLNKCVPAVEQPQTVPPGRCRTALPVAVALLPSGRAQVQARGGLAGGRAEAAAQKELRQQRRRGRAHHRPAAPTGAPSGLTVCAGLASRSLQTHPMQRANCAAVRLQMGELLRRRDGGEEKAVLQKSHIMVKRPKARPPSPPRRRCSVPRAAVPAYGVRHEGCRSRALTRTPRRGRVCWLAWRVVRCRAAR